MSIEVSSEGSSGAPSQAEGDAVAFGRAVQVRRAELALKRRELAERASLSYPYVSEIENGAKSPSAKALRQLADALELSPPELLTRAGWGPPVEWDAAGSSYHAARAGVRYAGPSTVGSGREPLAIAADLIAAMVQAEVTSWAQQELPRLVREEVRRLLRPQDESDD